MATAAPRRGSPLLDALAYAVVMTVLSFLSGVVVSLPFGLDWFVVEAVMFLEGWLMFGYGTFKLRPTPPWKRNRGGVRGKVRETLSLGDDEDATDNRPDTRVEEIVIGLPGVGERVPPADQRFSMGTKLFVAAIVVLVSSFLLERVVIV
jgi:hypothetical protein